MSELLQRPDQMFFLAKNNDIPQGSFYITTIEDMEEGEGGIVTSFDYAIRFVASGGRAEDLMGLGAAIAHIRKGNDVAVVYNEADEEFMDGFINSLAQHG